MSTNENSTREKTFITKMALNMFKKKKIAKKMKVKPKVGHVSVDGSVAYTEEFVVRRCT